MNPRPLAALLAVLLAAPLAAQTSREKTFNQNDDYNKRDMNKAEKLAAKNKTFAELDADQKEAVLRFLAGQIHGRRRRARSARVKVAHGKALNETGNDFCVAPGAPAKNKPVTSGGYTIVYSEEKVVPGQPITETKLVAVPVPDIKSSDFFDDNKWSFRPGAEDSLRRQLQEALKQPKSGKLYVSNVEILSSASTVFNYAYAGGKDPKDPTKNLMTHRELSRARANAVYAIVREELDRAGLLWKGEPSAPAPTDFSVADEKDDDSGGDEAAKRQIHVNSAGENGNGTSGPNSPYNCPTWLVAESARAEFAAKYCASGNGEAPKDAQALARQQEQAVAKAKKDGTADDSAIKAISSQIEKIYEPYRFVKVSLDLAAEVPNTEVKQTNDSEATIIVADMVFKDKTRIRLPQIEISFQWWRNFWHWVGGIFRRDNRGSVKCPKF